MSRLALPDVGEVHLWTASLRVSVERRRTLRRLLAPDEIARADRIVVPEKSEQSVVSRGVLRTLLSRYLGVAAESFAFRYGQNGRPALDGDHGLEFNVSHSGDLALVAVARGIELGVDVERVRADVDFLGVGSRFFSEREHADLRSVQEPERALAFFRCWTRKESYLKARGTGLALPLAGFDVTLLDDRPELLATRFDPADAPRWSLSEIRPRAGYVGALCASPAPDRVRLAGDVS